MHPNRVMSTASATRASVRIRCRPADPHLYREAPFSFIFVFAMAPETKGRPLEAIRVYWENGGRWPPESETAARVDRLPREEQLTRT